MLQQDYLFAGPGQAVDLMNGGHLRESLKLWRDVDGQDLASVAYNGNQDG